MSIAGLWHGASLNFIIWGFLNGLFLFFEKEIGIFLRFPKLIKIFFTCFIVFNLWVIFRIQEFDVMLNFFQILYTNLDTVILKENLLLLAVLILSIYSQIIDNYEAIHRTSKKIRFSFIIPIVVIIVITGLGINTGTSDKFIYFDF
tara:strand:+ start:40 stop:477 length:438 start_codon:yes stop_codon:yes gene_type:complete